MYGWFRAGLPPQRGGFRAVTSQVPEFMITPRSPWQASSSVLIEPAGRRALVELGMNVNDADLQDTLKMQDVLVEGFGALGMDYDVEGAILLWCPRTHRVFFAHPSEDVEKRTRRLLRAAAVMAAVA